MDGTMVPCLEVETDVAMPHIGVKMNISRMLDVSASPFALDPLVHASDFTFEPELDLNFDFASLSMPVTLPLDIFDQPAAMTAELAPAPVTSFENSLSEISPIANDGPVLSTYPDHAVIPTGLNTTLNIPSVCIP